MSLVCNFFHPRQDGIAALGHSLLATCWDCSDLDLVWTPI